MEQKISMEELLKIFKNLCRKYGKSYTEELENAIIDAAEIGIAIRDMIQSIIARVINDEEF